MATRVGTKQINGKTVACISSSGTSGRTIEHLYPSCRSKSSFFSKLREELTLPASTSMKEIMDCLRSKSWNGKSWVDDGSA
jgi:hypothetical protein